MADTFVELFQSRVKRAQKAEEDQRRHELADLEFEAGKHWTDQERQDREEAGRPCLTIDLLNGPIKQVTNQQRQARPGIQISPVGGGADVDHAERWQGLIRRVERLSQAQRAYAWAGQYQVKMGRGFWVVRNIEVGEDGEQDIRIVEVDNQHTVLVDPSAKRLDGSDKKWAVLFEDLTHEDYKARFGESKIGQALTDGHFQPDGSAPPAWMTSEHIRIAEYFWIEETPRTKLILSNGERVWEDELETVTTGRGKRKVTEPVLPEGVSIVRKVKRTTTAVKWALVNGAGEILEEADIPGDYIPVVMVYGERRNINGVLDYRGLVRMAKDPSRMEDFCESSLMEAITDAKTSPWLAEWDQISEFANIWRMQRPPKVLPYKRVSGENGAPIPPPSRVSSGADVSALTMAAQRMQNHVRQTAGQSDIFQNETGAMQSQLSGRAILARQQGQELGTSDYLENLGDGIVLTAKIIMSMARDGVYDTPRLMRIVGADEQQQNIVTYMGPDQQGYAEQMQTADIAGMFDLSVGEFDIAVSPGKNYQTARMEASEAITAAIQAFPPIAQVALPILFKNSDWPGALELAKKLEPPQDQQAEIPPAVQQRMQQMQQQLQEAAKIIETDRVKEEGRMQTEQTRLQAQIELERLKTERELLLRELDLKHALALESLKAQLALRKQDDQQAHEVAMRGAEVGVAPLLMDNDQEMEERR